MQPVLRILALLCILLPVSVAAQTTVDLELVLAVDASRSIDAHEYRLQREGYVQALRHPDVLRAIKSGAHGRIALTYIEWSNISQQAVLVGWTVIDGEDAAERFVQRLLVARRPFLGTTSVSSAIDFSVSLFGAKGIRGIRRVIDISGDGPNNRGRQSEAARDDAVRAGVTINGLAIVNTRSSRPPWIEEPVDEHYRDKVIGGPGAFMMSVTNFRDFGVAIRKKLVREISALPASNRRLQRAGR